MYAHAVAMLQRQFLKLHTSALQSLAGYQSACMRRLLTCCSGRIPNCSGRIPNCSGRIPNCSSRIPNCMHTAAVALLQWQDTKLLHRVKDEQTCNNNNSSNNKARCIPVELCKLSRVKRESESMATLTTTIKSTKQNEYPHG
jgi:hypothetical protein